MNQLYEKKCHCQPYDEDGHRSTLIKMELPEYEDSHYPSMSHSIAGTIRFAFYLLVLVLLGYSLWRIHEIESVINASERYQNITRLIESNNLNHHKRIARSVEANSFLEPNGLGGMGGKDELRGMMLMARNENPTQVTKKFLNKDDFVQHMNDLFDKIQAMHNDSDRSHFDNNMKAVFQAWFPVFDALLPREMIENPDNRTKRSAVKSSEESDEKKDRKQEPNQKSSEESGEKKEQRPNKSSEESSEKKKTRTTRSAEQSSEESSEVNNNDNDDGDDDDSKQDNAAENKNSEEESSEDKGTTEAANVANEESEEEHARKVRSADDQSSEESSDSSDSSDSYESSKPSKRYEPLEQLKQDYIRASKYVYNLQRRLIILEQENNNMNGENETNKM